MMIRTGIAAILIGLAAMGGGVYLILKYYETYAGAAKLLWNSGLVLIVCGVIAAVVGGIRKIVEKKKVT